MQSTVETLGGIPGWDKTTAGNGEVTYYHDHYMLTVNGHPMSARSWRAWRPRTGGGVLTLKYRSGVERKFTTADAAARAAVEKWVTPNA